MLQSALCGATVFSEIGASGMSKDPKTVVQEIVQLVGQRRAERFLIAEEISPSLAGKLARGNYESEVTLLTAAAIERARVAAAQAS